MNSEIFIDCWLLFPSKNKFLSFCLAAMILKTKTSYSQPQIQQVFQNIIIFLSARKAPEHICKVHLGGRSSIVGAGRLNTAIPVASNSCALSKHYAIPVLEEKHFPFLMQVCNSQYFFPPALFESSGRSKQEPNCLRF